ncbi:hypothetical protein B0T26DRAFT_680992 [Lasiosphaeria miniovina]|uniref:Uncharacterized protein n=1 Tax=Lasiosphaeria miniovina TaxID=1954250 RepID=A0AA39ZTB0_9PEZI|nr:uncharacterized protein B0T26DRAFT_680992 [Lasiosphaeria miniovina]KAK0703292.1 hypothetical protein B0T26DRAFT_680992 [Lasiosphaeria miniovina]
MMEAASRWQDGLALQSSTTVPTSHITLGLASPVLHVVLVRQRELELERIFPESHVSLGPEKRHNGKGAPGLELASNVDGVKAGQTKLATNVDGVKVGHWLISALDRHKIHFPQHRGTKPKGEDGKTPNDVYSSHKLDSISVCPNYKDPNHKLDSISACPNHKDPNSSRQLDSTSACPNHKDPNHKVVFNHKLDSTSACPNHKDPNYKLDSISAYPNHKDPNHKSRRIPHSPNRNNVTVLTEFRCGKCSDSGYESGSESSHQAAIETVSTEVGKATGSESGH